MLRLCIGFERTERRVLPRWRSPRGPGAGAQIGELVDPHRLRVCADPGNLPYSNQAEEGFENKIAELLAAKLGAS